MGQPQKIGNVMKISLYQNCLYAYIMHLLTLAVIRNKENTAKVNGTHCSSASNLCPQCSRITVEPDKGLPLYKAQLFTSYLAAYAGLLPTADVLHEESLYHPPGE